MEGTYALPVGRKGHRRAEPMRPVGVIGMAVGEHHAFDFLAGGAPDGVQVHLVVGAGIYNPAAENVGVGSVQGERRRVRCPHADDAGWVIV